MLDISTQVSLSTAATETMENNMLAWCMAVQPQASIKLAPSSKQDLVSILAQPLLRTYKYIYKRVPPSPCPLTLQQEYDPGQPLHWRDEEVLQALAGTLGPRLVGPQEGMKAGVLLVAAVQALLADLKVVDEGRVHMDQLVSLCGWEEKLEVGSVWGVTYVCCTYVHMYIMSYMCVGCCVPAGGATASPHPAELFRCMCCRSRRRYD